MKDNRVPLGEGTGGQNARTTSRLSDGEFYKALASTQRRRLLYTLLDREEHDVDEIASVLTDWESPAEGRPESAEDRVALRHLHLPMLEDAGLVTYDHEERTVRLASVAPVVEDLIRRSIDAEGESASPQN